MKGFYILFVCYFTVQGCMLGIRPPARIQMDENGKFLRFNEYSDEAEIRQYWYDNQHTMAGKLCVALYELVYSFKETSERNFTMCDI